MISKSLNYIIFQLEIKMSKLFPIKINICILERKKMFFLQNINYNNDYYKIYKEFHNEMMNLASNRNNNTLSILNNNRINFFYITEI